MRKVHRLKGPRTTGIPTQSVKQWSHMRKVHRLKSPRATGIPTQSVKRDCLHVMKVCCFGYYRTRTLTHHTKLSDSYKPYTLNPKP